MKNRKLILVCVALTALFVIPQIVSAAGSFESFGTGLWGYYAGKSMSWVRSNAPEFDQVTSERYLLDEAVMKGIELYLIGDFQNRKLTLLQIMTPYPDYTVCTDDVKEITYSLAALGTLMMGVDIDPSEDCFMDDGWFMCLKGKDFCMIELCPEEMGSFACTSVDYLNQ